MSKPPRKSAWYAALLRQPARYPAWLASLGFHAVLLLFVLWFWRQSSVIPASPEWTTIAGIHLRESHVVESVEAPAEPSPDTPTNPEAAVSEVVSASPSRATMMLQPTGDVATTNAHGTADGTGGNGGGGATVSVFGAQATGNRFVFILDCSETMNDYAQAPLRAAQRELHAALDSLGEGQLVNIVAYNDQFTPLVTDSLFEATDANLARGHEWLAGLVARGGTQHEPPLAAALAMRPDVIFLLTDAEANSDLTAAAAQRLLASRRGTQIHLIQFGPHRSTHLERIVRQTGGTTTRTSLPVP